ncbi:zinc-binding alcohol dehydrogenase family protein [Pseudomonas fulva]|jgi:zinc-binding alcohol dehydrogenase family protein|uniref:Zinc-binding alcohol dehydrogenase family protein n=1 Tax=Pseudomonas putida TaxID=303 RepID=A0AAW6PPU0_PSEPU|nr:MULTISPECIES: zinc-binding alcohol dehydrogenase family protein [Pseudomonas]AXQ48174.1 zinc-binding alcohol dehydrogenase family protein [Stenotrophomonas rhizophila]PPB16907.1 zinc-binding alcohol dehydrogenase family protein [Pseudomonas aeruginosa]AGN79088.1 NADPH:quinone reductase [Pseudomonas putida H8234]EGC00541.1 zinc-binding alcohol dehydrogenase [Pseudomonas sp. TJI-51]MBA1219144.1 zinc-binding alcohol dehydrogenase family protein [Pseudomonas fulva]
MKAISFTQHALPIDNPQALIDISLPRPTPGPRDLLVEVRAVSVNPVDTKVRAGTFTKEPKILGWDATGIVREVGAEVTLFQPGDEVFYAGSIARTGSYSEFHLVDERIVGHKPHSLSAADAAALPLTSITAWELLFDRLGVVEGTGEGKCLLITGAAGGVGSMLVQLARKLTRLTVIGTASRQETADWVRQLGAHHVIDHSQPLLAQLQALGVPEIDYVASLTHTEQHLVSIAVLKAKAGKEQALKEELLTLIEPTRAEPGNLDYVLFEQRDEQGTFYMREAFRDQAALDAHFSMPYFQRFAATADDLLQEPLQLIFLEQVSA